MHRPRYVLLHITLASLLLFPLSACSKSKENKAELIQKPVVAGMFYPAGRSALRKEVERYISKAPRKSFDGELIGLIAPHAGYRYSGPVAGAAFRQLEGDSFTRVVVMAPSHRVPFSGVVFPPADIYRTPLGDIPIDTDAVRSLVNRYTWAAVDQRTYDVEHSLEVELPFLQVALKEFRLVPMIVGQADKKTLDAIASALNSAFPESHTTLFVASTDLSHYQPYEKAMKLDRGTIALVCDRSPDEYYHAVRTNDARLCGSLPVYILKRITEMRKGRLELIEYANSGDTAGDRSRVVGYAAVAAVVPPCELSESQKRTLLELSRATLLAHVKGEGLPPLPDDPGLKHDGAAFVTLRKDGRLRGCIGHTIARGPLDRCVRDMTVAAASSDPRFPPVKPEELNNISIEISVLTTPRDLPNPLAVRVGTDGLIIQEGAKQGVLLPQVPTEQGWTKEQYLEGICHKAGLPTDAWRTAKLLRFQAMVFSERH